MNFYLGYLTLIRFVAWNFITSLGEKDQYYAGSDSNVGSDTSNVCYMVQWDNPLEVTTESEVEEDVDMSYNELVVGPKAHHSSFDDDQLM